MIATLGLAVWLILTLVAITMASRHRKDAFYLCLLGGIIQAVALLGGVIFRDKLIRSIIGDSLPNLFSSAPMTGGFESLNFIKVILPSIIILLCIVPVVLVFAEDPEERVNQKLILAMWTVHIPGIGGLWVYSVRAILVGKSAVRIKIKRIDENVPKEKVTDPIVLEKTAAKDLQVITRLYEGGEFMRLAPKQVTTIITDTDKKFVGLAPEGTAAPIALKSLKDIQVHF